MKIVLALLTFLIAAPSYAQRVIANGGGLGEMQAIYFNGNLQTYLRPCLTNNCGLSEADRDTLRRTIESQSQAEDATVLEFTVDKPGNLPVATERRPGAPIRIYAAALYDAQGAPLPMSSAAAFVLAGRLAHFDLTSPMDRLLELARQVLAEMKVQKESLQILSSPSLIAVHDYWIQLGGQPRQSLFLEDDQRTMEVSQLVQSILPCGALQDWQFQRWSGGFAGGRAVFYVDAKSSCDPGQAYVLTIDVILDKSGLVIEDSIRAAMKVGF